MIALVHFPRSRSLPRPRFVARLAALSAVSAVLLAMAAGCAESDRVAAVPPSESNEPYSSKDLVESGFVFDQGTGSVAAVGGEIFALNSRWIDGSSKRIGESGQVVEDDASHVFVVRNSGGMWTDLAPPALAFGARELFALGTSIVVVGWVCDTLSTCETRQLRGQVWETGTQQWTELVLPKQIEASEGTTDLVLLTASEAAISTDVGLVHLDKELESEWSEPPPLGENPEAFVGALCGASDSLVLNRIEMLGVMTDEPVAGVPEMVVAGPMVWDTARQKWLGRDAPTSQVPGSFVRTCTKDAAITISGGNEAAYDPAEDRWALRAVTLPPEMESGRALLTPFGVRSVTSGEEYFVDLTTSSVLRRLPDGTWQSSGISASAVIDVDGRVVALNSEGLVTEVDK